ncbi:VWA domain-containing protein [Mesorhizobium sp. LHD-90]|uniref:vWA domain-containing protein n=1 Tax=Mesorhizobium sp. LHD-90 TaxID=3071414 RepID=UPI0027DECF6F|nr:VWA domain-containing protein [Mesorhizobium sp. LHD-90]MDQ6436669.1 VWA domain-containing protein [Mesorhizobium sp. LHD-90]
MSVLLRALVAVVCSGVAASASAADRTIVVLDASGSMWSQIGGRPKQMIAREALREALKTLPAGREVGLVAYGHRDKNSCDDVELLVPPAVGAANAIMSAADRLKFLGKTPLVAAARKAAEDLDYENRKATVVLLTDGADSCGADACALGRELEQRGADFTAQIVGFGLNAEQGRQVTCLAEATGGRFFPAADAAALQETLKQALAEIPAAAPAVQPPPAAATPAASVPSVEPTPAADEKPELNFMPSVVLAEGGEPLTDAGPSYEIYAADAEGGKGERIGIEFYPYRGALKPGDYIVRATLGEAAVEQPLKVEAGKTYQPVYVLNAGTLVVRPRAVVGGEVSNAASVVVDYPGASYPATYYGEARMVLPAGDQKIMVRIGGAETTEIVRLAAGQTVEKDVVVPVGHLRVDAFYKASGEKIGASGLAITVFKAGGSGEEAGYGYGSESSYDLPPGDYRVVARLDRAEAEVSATVRASEPSRVTVVLDAGTLSISAPDADEIEIFGAAKDAQGNRKSLGRAYGDSALTTLPAGDYVISAGYAETDRKSEATATVRAGERTEIRMTRRRPG